MIRIVKLRQPYSHESFAEVLREGPVQFDSREGWLLLAIPIGARQPRQTLFWEHPADGRILWDRLMTLEQLSKETAA